MLQWFAKPFREHLVLLQAHHVYSSSSSSKSRDCCFANICPSWLHQDLASMKRCCASCMTYLYLACKRSPAAQRLQPTGPVLQGCVLRQRVGMCSGGFGMQLALCITYVCCNGNLYGPCLACLPGSACSPCWGTAHVHTSGVIQVLVQYSEGDCSAYFCWSDASMIGM